MKSEHLISAGAHLRPHPGTIALPAASAGPLPAQPALKTPPSARAAPHWNGPSLGKDTYDQAQQAIATQRPGVDHLIKDLWDTIEYNLRHQPAPSLRRRAREWGVVYINDDGTEETDPPEPPAPPTP